MRAQENPDIFCEKGPVTGLLRSLHGVRSHSYEHLVGGSLGSHNVFTMHALCFHGVPMR